MGGEQGSANSKCNKSFQRILAMRWNGEGTIEGEGNRESARENLQETWS